MEFIRIQISIPRIITESDDSFHCHSNLRRRCQIPTVFVLRKKTKIRNVPEKTVVQKKDVQNSSQFFNARSNHCCVSKHRQQQQWCQQQLLVSVLPTLSTFKWPKYLAVMGQTVFDVGSVSIRSSKCCNSWQHCLVQPTTSSYRRRRTLTA